MMGRKIILFLFALALAPLAAFAQADTSWDTLAKVKLVKEGTKFTPRFDGAVQTLSGKQIRVKGFMLPLEQAAKQQHFILSANPVANCFFCMPGGPETLIEVRLDKPVEFSYDPITISGKLELLKDDPMGMFYRLTAASVGR